MKSYDRIFGAGPLGLSLSLILLRRSATSVLRSQQSASPLSTAATRHPSLRKTFEPDYLDVSE